MPGFADVVSFGREEKKYDIENNPTEQANYDLSPREVFDAVSKSNINIGGNVIERGIQAFAVRRVGLLESVEESEMDLSPMKNQINIERDTPGLIPPGRSFLKRVKPDNFVLLLFGMVILARFVPGPGIAEGRFSLSNLASYGVTLIFFFYGLRLSPQKFAAGLSKWKLHLLIQSTTFLFFPLLALLGFHFFENQSNHFLWLGIFFLAALPSTVSSSIVMVSIAGGNLPGAIFNASVSSLLGVFLTPVWMRIFLDTASASFDISGIVGKLALQILLPLVLGLLLHGKLGAFAEKHKSRLRTFDQTVILVIVYTSFCESFAGHLFSGIGLTDLLLLSAGMLALFYLMYFLIRQACRFLKFDREDTIAAVFCGSKKSLVHGTVLSKVLFAGSPVTGLLLLPLMIYHALQIVTASILAQKMAVEAKV